MVCVLELVCGAMCGLSSCGWQRAKEVIATAERMDKTEHVVYDDTAAIAGVIRKLDNPLGKLIHKNTLGKAYYFMGRNLSLSNHIAEAAECYIEADRLQIDDPIYRGRVNSCMGYICAQNNSDSLALIFYERASKDFLESKDEWYYAQTLLDRAEFQTNLHNYVIADSLLQNALSYNLDSAYIARYYETKGLYYYELQQHDSALVYFKKSIKLHQMDPSYTYLKILQTFHRIQLLDSAIPYAQWIISNSNNPNYRLNAYYILITKATQENQINLLAEYSEARQDTHRILESLNETYSIATQKLLLYLNNPHPWRWGWILLVTIAFVCLLAVIGVVVFRKRSLNAHKQIDDLSNRLEEQEAVQSEQQRQYDADMCLSDIRAKYPKPRKQWNDYNRLKKDLNAPLQKLLCALDNSELGNKEKVFCVLHLVYSHCSLIELADYINYSEKGIRNYKQRIAQKLHISSAELYDFLLNQLRN